MNKTEKKKIAEALLSAASSLSGSALTRIEKSWGGLEPFQRLFLLEVVFNAIGIDNWWDSVLENEYLTLVPSEEDLSERRRFKDDPKFVEFVINKYKDRLSVNSVIDGYIPWLVGVIKKQSKRSEHGKYISFDEEIVKLFRAICVWASETKTDIGKVSLEEALEKADSYTPRAARKALEDSDANPVVYRFADGYKVVNLKTDEALKLEGDRMKHCVGTYCDNVKSGESVIYSVRSPDGDPEKDVTLEYRPNSKRLAQMFGPGNRKPKPEQQKYLIEFIEAKFPHDKLGLMLAGKPAKDINFKGENLERANLRDANFEGADLRDANLRGADLRGANLRDANLEGANLRGANLRGAKLIGADLTGAKLIGADLIGAKLGNANLREANLREANLREANLERANLEGANLEGANLYGANLYNANLEGANLYNANLYNANLEGADLGYAKLIGANLTGANLTDANLEGANLTGANLYYANLEGANLEGANLEGANLRDANLEGANLGYANLRGAILRDAKLEGIKYSEETMWPEDFTPPESAIAAAHTEIPAPEGAPKPQVFKKPKKSGPDEFTIEGDKGKKITLLAEIQATLEEVARLLK
jgi:uncharacterized protein YjbI with pentapeptide repeats